jgi:hypothetical protein
MKDITITIAGPQGAGKTVLMGALNQVLRNSELAGIRACFRKDQQFVQQGESNPEVWVMEEKPATPHRITIAEAVKQWQTVRVDIWVRPERQPVAKLMKFADGAGFLVEAPRIPVAYQTPQDAIRAELAARRPVFLTTQYGTDMEIVDTGCLTRIPLGPNKTADGREARVICNDGPEGFPVAAYVDCPNGTTRLLAYNADGTRGQQGEEYFNLVGHLPPEPVKPREFVIRRDSESGPAYLATVSDSKVQPGEKIRVREVTPATGKQHHVWVSDDGESFMGAPDIDETWAVANGYRKTVLMEVQP